MDVYEAVTSRRAVRGFTDEPVSREVLERVLSAAAWSPSGSNLQPWNCYVLTGALLAELKTRAVERVAHGDPWDEREYEMYPRALKSPYGERRSAFGKERYSALGIAREDWEARQRAAIANWNCFGAVAPKNSIRPDSRSEAESAHHCIRWSRSSACLQRLSPTCSSRGGGLKAKFCFSVINSISR